MKRIWLLAVVGLLAISDVAQAAEAPKFVSTTFKEILTRVTQRDKESQAIQWVKRKADAPYPKGVSNSPSPKSLTLMRRLLRCVSMTK